MMSNALIVLMAIGCVPVWSLIVQRWRQGLPLIPWAPRRPVPWGERELLMLLLGFLFITSLLSTIFLPLDDELPDNPLPAESSASAPAESPGTKPDDPLAHNHPVVQLLVRKPSALNLLVAVLAAVFVAPIAEELSFRVVFQGWLERSERRWLARFGIRRWPRGLASILVSASVFASIHFLGRGEGTLSESQLEALLKLNAAAPALAAVLTIVYLTWKCGATEADLGLTWRYWKSDVLVGLAGFLAIGPPINLLQWVLFRLFPNSPVTLDPIPLFLLALVLGYLYQRTHRLLPSVVLHFGVNAFSLLLLFASPESAGGL